MTKSTAGMEARLHELRGDLKTRRPNARTVAAGLDAPGCRRRSLLDAAHVDKGDLARRVGHEFNDRQSPFALRRGKLFEEIVTRDGCAHLLAQLRDKLGFAIPAARFKDLSVSVANTTGETELRLRAKETLAALKRLATGDDSAYNVIRHAVTTLRVGDTLVYLEQDALAFLLGGKLHVVEIKGFPIVAGTPVDQSHLAQAARQTAVYVLSLAQTLEALTLPLDLLSTDVLLICAKGYGLTPTSAVLDVRREIHNLERQLSRRTRIADLLAALPAGMTLHGDASVLARTLEQLPNDYLPACLSGCELSYFCRERALAAGETSVLGVVVRNVVGGLDDIHAAATASRTGQCRAQDADVVAALTAARRAFEASRNTA